MSTSDKRTHAEILWHQLYVDDGSCKRLLADTVA